MIDWYLVDNFISVVKCNCFRVSGISFPLRELELLRMIIIVIQYIWLDIYSFSTQKAYRSIFDKYYINIFFGLKSSFKSNSYSVFILIKKILTYKNVCLCYLENNWRNHFVIDFIPSLSFGHFVILIYVIPE